MFTNSAISSYQSISQYQGFAINSVESVQQTGQDGTTSNALLVTDQVNLSYSSESILTYDSSMNVSGTQGDGFDLLRGLILNIFKEQGLDTKIAMGDSTVDISSLSQEDAQALVADNGYFGVDKTSQRIFDLATGIAGGDISKIDAIRAGIEKGFQEAKEAFGGTLPEISYKTYDAVMQKLDDWAGGHASQQS